MRNVNNMRKHNVQKVESLSSKRIKLIFTINTILSSYEQSVPHNLYHISCLCGTFCSYDFTQVGPICLMYWCKTLSLVYIPFGVRFMCIVYIAYMDIVVLIVKISFIRFEDKLSTF